MSPEYLVVTACITVLLKCVATTTGGTNRTHDPALNSVTVSSRQEINAPVAPSFLTLHGSAPAAKVVAHGPWIDEERGLNGASTAAEKVVDVALSSMEHLHPPEPLAPLPGPEFILSRRATCAEIAQWIEKADAHHAKTGTFPDVAVLKGLLQSVGGKEEDLVRYLDHSWYSDIKAQARVTALRKALVADLPTAKWLKMSQSVPIPPQEVFEMMSIGTERGLLSDDRTKVLAVDTYNEHKQWLAYADWFCETQQYSPVDGDLPQFKKTSEDLLQLFTVIEPKSEETTSLQKMLYVVFPTIRKQMFDFWLTTGKTPTEVFELMPISRHHLEIDNIAKSNKQHFEDDLEWIRFSNKFKERSVIFSSDVEMVKRRKDMVKAMTADSADDAEAARRKADTVAALLKDETVNMLLKMYPVSEMSKEDAIRQLLKNEVLAEQVWYRALADVMITRVSKQYMAKFFFGFRHAKGMETHAATMQQHMLNGASPETEKAVFDVWVGSSFLPEQAFDAMPFALTKHYDSAVERDEGAVGDLVTNFKQWLRYIEYFRTKHQLDDDQVVARLRKKRYHGVKPDIEAAELKVLSSGLKDYPGWKDLASKLVEANV